MITRIPLYKREGFPTTYVAAIRLINQNYKKGSCEPSFKKHYSNHKKSFNVPLYKHDTKLPKGVLELKNEATK